MSVAGLKKQFHKATQVRRVTGAPRGGPGRSREGRAWSVQAAGSVGPRPSRRAPQRPPRPQRRGTGNPPSSPPPAQCGALGTSGCRASRLVAPRTASAPPSEGATGRGPRLHSRPGAQVPRGGGRLCKVAYFPDDLAVSVHRLSRDVLARTGARTEGGCGDALGLGSSLCSLNHSFRGRAGSEG